MTFGWRQVVNDMRLVYNRTMTVWLLVTENILKSQSTKRTSLFEISYHSNITIKINYST